MIISNFSSLINCLEFGATVVSSDYELGTEIKGKISIAFVSIASKLREKVDFETIRSTNSASDDLDLKQTNQV